jgi:putative membrane protein
MKTWKALLGLITAVVFVVAGLTTAQATGEVRDNANETETANSKKDVQDSMDKDKKDGDKDDAKKDDDMKGGDKKDDDSGFVMKAAQAGMAEIRMGQAAIQNGSSPEVKAFAQRMVDDHLKANSELLWMAQKKGITVPPMLTDKDRMAMEKMSTRTGADFDKSYMEHQVKAHQTASELFSKQAESGDDADLKAYASKYLPAINEHLDMARKWTASASPKDKDGDKDGDKQSPK